MNSNLLILIVISLFLSSFSIRNLKEENTEEENKNLNEEETCEKDHQEEIDFSKISSSKIRKENMPHSQVLLPIRRLGTSNMQMGKGPCGDIEKKSSNTLTTKGSSINFVWEVLVPENSGNCTVSISNGIQKEENFKLLKPIDGKFYADGSFECGREKGFESKEFLLPADYECDGCTLQWKWATSYGDIYSCSDIVINGEQIKKCMGKCLNGGTCFNGKCLCLDQFSGEFCENDKEKSSLTFLWYLFYLILIGAAGYGIYKYWNQIQNLFKSTKSWLTGKKVNSEMDFGGEIGSNDKIDTNQVVPDSNYQDQ